MRICSAAILAITLTAATSRAADAPAATYTDPKNGFSMNAPDLGTSPTTATPIMFFGPSVHGFSPNVNITIQKIKTNRKDYLELSLKQFAAAKATINSQKELTVSGHDAAIIDYEMNVSGAAGKTTHHLALMVIAEDKVYLITATALKDDFAASEGAFRKCLDSFTLPK